MFDLYVFTRIWLVCPAIFYWFERFRECGKLHVGNKLHAYRKEKLEASKQKTGRNVGITDWDLSRLDRQLRKRTKIDIVTDSNYHPMNVHLVAKRDADGLPWVNNQN